MPIHSLLKHLKGGLIVSCQAEESEPLHGPIFMAAMARAVAMGGAAAIRANGPDDIAAIRSAVTIPIIGLFKADLPGFKVRITPTPDHAQRVAAAGADVIALDATDRSRPNGLSVAELISQVRRMTGCPVVADISTLEEGLAAADAGADVVATTLAGYTDTSPVRDGPDFDLIERLASTLSVPLLAEGRISTPGQAGRALELGAYAVVVGTAITRPQRITESFVAGMRISR